MNKILFTAVTCVSFLLTSCIFSSSKKVDPQTLRNTYPDYQHISGKVKGIWTKDHNPHALVNITTLMPGDTLTIKEGVVLEGPYDLDVSAGSFLVVEGSDSLPVIFNAFRALHSNMGGGLNISGHAKMSHFIDQVGFLLSASGSSPTLEIDHATYIHGANEFRFLDSIGNPGVQQMHISIRNSIFAVPITSLLNDGPVLLYTKDGLADTSLWTVENNCFYREGMDSGTIDPGYYLSTKQGVFTAPTWPGNGNVAALPDFVSYTIAYKDTVLWHRSDSVLITQVYDLHVKAGSPCANMGAYAP